MRIGIVAGEVSGDKLGSGLLRSLKLFNPELVAEGIGGPEMIREGLKLVADMDEISVIGIDGLLKSLTKIFKIRHQLVEYYAANPPDIFIGIDLPDFNLSLEKKLKALGIPIIHYVSPTVWAWRGWRIKKIQKAVDHMFVLFPFERDFYKKHAIDVTFVGHPSADELPTQTKSELRIQLKLPLESEVIALLPGSRKNEVINLSAPFLETAKILVKSRPDIHFVIPYASKHLRNIFCEKKSSIYPDIKLHEYCGNSMEVMAASDAVLLASGTAALEATMLRRPMVVAYKMSKMSYMIASKLIKTPYISMPNNLLGAPIIPELLQNNVNGLQLANELIKILDNEEHTKEITSKLNNVYRELKNNANTKAAKKLLALIQN